jgi:hypothetical protein
VGIRLKRVTDSATTVCVKTFINNATVTVPAPNVPTADVFGIGIVHWHLVQYNRYKLHTPCLRLPPLPRRACFKIRELHRILPLGHPSCGGVRKLLV